MRYETLDIKNKYSQDYSKLTVYLLDDSREIAIHKRPMVIVCPGGGYGFTSDREAEIVALQFAAMGYHTAVLRYSVAPAVFPAAILEVGKSVALIRSHAKEWFVDADRIAIVGFSAGGHLTANYGTFWHKDFLQQELGVEKEMLRPNAMILGYPVITSGEFAHQGSFMNLLAEDYEARKEEFSLENCVTEETPRAFLWHTYEDALVPVQNSLLFVNALVAKNIPVEFHMFQKGAHGLSLANRLTGTIGLKPEGAAAAWIPLVQRWMENWIAEDEQ